MDSRENVLQKYAFNSKRYDREDVEKYEQEQTFLFKLIQDVDRQRRHILDNLLLKLKRHQSLLSKIKSGWNDKMEELEDKYTDDDDYKRILSYYNEAFYIEKKRCIDILEKHLVKATQSFDGFRQTLTTPEFLHLQHPIIKSYHEQQTRLCLKMLHTCENWRRLLLGEEFNFNVPTFVLEPDEKRTK